jgi:hypothetical protein
MNESPEMNDDSAPTTARNRALGIAVMVIVGPPLLILFLGGVDIVGNLKVNPIAYLADPLYRAETRARWSSMSPEARGEEIRGTVLAAMSLSALAVVSGVFYYSVYHLVRYHSFPEWLTRFL